MPHAAMMPMGEENEHLRSSASVSAHGHGNGHGHSTATSGPIRHNSGSREREREQTGPPNGMYVAGGAGALGSSSAMEMRGASMDVQMPQRPESALRRETAVH